MLKRIADVLKSVAVIVTFLLVVLLILVVGRDVVWPTPSLESVSVPSFVQQWGYTPNVFAQKVSDRSREIAQNSKRIYDLAHPRESIGTQPIEAKIPGSDFTTRSAGQFVSDILARPNKRIIGEVTKVGSTFDVSLRIIGGEHLATTITSSSDSVDAEAIVSAATELAMKLAAPYTLAASFYNEEKDAAGPANFARTLSVLDYMIVNSKEPYYAHSLKCNVLTRLARYDDAKEQCEKAIAIDRDDWPAHANFGDLYYSLAEPHISNRRVPGGLTERAKENCREAIKQFSKAEQSHHLKQQLYDNWVMCLEALGMQDEVNKLRSRLRDKS
jgi:tetratricopeptide (TPR) repeat protein